MTRKLTSSDIFDINKKTGALILGKNRLDDYATKYLTKYCKDALINPMPLPVEEILQKAGLTVEEVSLSNNFDIFGCCLLLDGEVDIYDNKTGMTYTTFYSAGTILIDPKSEALYGDGAKRNTLIHEALHWEKDKTYFEIMAIKNAEVSDALYPIMCRQSETFYDPPEGKKTKENEVKWLEWQAHRLAPRILMPFETFKEKALELLCAHQSHNNNILSSCDALIEELSSFFIVSRTSVKHRLIEVGLQDKISEFDDYDAVFSEINRSNGLMPLTPIEAYQLILRDSSLQEWLHDGRFIFVDGYFVLADEKFVMAQEGVMHLTSKAKKNLAKCVINIREHKHIAYPNMQKDFMGCAILYNIAGVDKRMLTFHPKYQNNFEYEPDDVYAAFNAHISEYDENEEIELIQKLGDPTTTLCQCLWFLMENRKWKYPAIFSEKTWLHENYHGKIKNNNLNNIGTNNLMAICVGMKLNLRMIEKLFDKSQNKLDYYHNPDKTYIRILETMPYLSIQDFNSILKEADLNELGTKMRLDEE